MTQTPSKYGLFSAALIATLAIAFCVEDLSIGASAEHAGPWLTKPDVTDPHGNQDGCAECHDEREPSKESFNYASCLECHEEEAHRRAVHLVRFSGDDPTAPVPELMPLRDGRSTCITCHEIACKLSRSNRRMLREAPLPREEEFCFRCHRRELYRAFNPHGTESRSSEESDLPPGSRLGSWGESEGTLSCLFCHRSVSMRGDPASGEVRLAVEPPIHEDLGHLCLTCHADVQHEREHMDRSIIKNRIRGDLSSVLREFERSGGVRLPLKDGEYITCATCHRASSACRADVERRGEEDELRKALLRVPKEQICYACHDL